MRPVSPCNFYFLSIYIMTYNTRFVFQTKKTTKLISKQARLNATKSVLVTLIAEADRVLCQLVMFLTAFFY